MHCMTDPKCHVTYKHLGTRNVKTGLRDPMGDNTRTLLRCLRGLRKRKIPSLQLLDLAFTLPFVSNFMPLWPLDIANSIFMICIYFPTLNNEFNFVIIIIVSQILQCLSDICVETLTSAIPVYYSLTCYFLNMSNHQCNDS